MVFEDNNLMRSALKQSPTMPSYGYGLNPYQMPHDIYSEIDSGKLLYEDPVSEEMLSEDKHMRFTLEQSPAMPFGHFYRRAASYTSPTSLFKFGRLPEDDSLLQNLVDAQLLWRTNGDMVHVANDAVASLILGYAYPRPIWKKIQAIKDHGVYTSVLKAVASLVLLLFSQGLLLEIGYRHMFAKQIQDLWEDLAVERRKAIPVDEFCKAIILRIRGNPKYCPVSEIDLAEMCSCYHEDYEDYERGDYGDPCTNSFTVSDPFSNDMMRKPPSHDQVVDKRGLYNDIMKVLEEMKSPPTILKADGYTRLLMRILRGYAVDEEELLLDNSMNMVDTKAVKQYDLTLDLRAGVLRSILNTMRIWMKQQLMQVVMPLFHSYVHGTHHTSHEILDIVEVAEIRRTALGSRFIGRSHLIWAFYECGYGLPPKIRDTIQVHPDEDHPPYHIYMSAMNLAKALGEKTTQLEHFVFAVLHSKDIGCDGEAICLQHFSDFHEVLLSKMMTSAVETLSLNH